MRGIIFYYFILQLRRHLLCMVVFSYVFHYHEKIGRYVLLEEFFELIIDFKTSLKTPKSYSSCSINSARDQQLEIVSTAKHNIIGMTFYKH